MTIPTSVTESIWRQVSTAIAIVSKFDPTDICQIFLTKIDHFCPNEDKSVQMMTFCPTHGQNRGFDYRTIFISIKNSQIAKLTQNSKIGFAQFLHCPTRFEMSQVARIPNYEKGGCMSEIEKPESRNKKPEAKNEKRDSKLLDPEG